jgi:hypothetical protein
MAKSKQREETEGIRHGLEKPEGLLPDRQPEKPDVEEEEGPEKLSRTECAQHVIAEIDGDCTLKELGEKADQLFVAGRGGDEDYSDPDTAEWHVQKILQTLEGVGLVELGWECVVHPLVARLGLPSKDGK